MPASRCTDVCKLWNGWHLADESRHHAVCHAHSLRARTTNNNGCTLRALYRRRCTLTISFSSCSRKLAGFFLPARSKPTHLQSHPGKAPAQKPGSRRAGQDVICCLCMHVQHAGIHPSIHCRNQCLPADSPARCRCKPQVKGPLWRRRHRSRRLPPLADHKMAAAAVGDWSPLRKAFTHKHLKGFCGVNVTHTHTEHIHSISPVTRPEHIQ